jgi:hypothetical protein
MKLSPGALIIALSVIIGILTAWCYSLAARSAPRNHAEPTLTT